MYFNTPHSVTRFFLALRSSVFVDLLRPWGLVLVLILGLVLVAAVSGYSLRLHDDALEFLEYRELLVGVINLGVALAFADKKADFLQTLKFALDVAGVFFNKFS